MLVNCTKLGTSLAHVLFLSPSPSPSLSLSPSFSHTGIQYVSPIEDFPREQWDKILSINLSAAFHTTRLAVKGMKERGADHVIIS